VAEPEATVSAPLGPSRPAGDTGCARLTDGGHCGRPSTHHVIWTPDAENGVMCAEHFAEAQRRWVFYDVHPLGAFCTLPGMTWVLSWEQPPGDCAMEVDGETAALVLEAGLRAEIPIGGVR
jgi:hypothetical protein